MPEKRRKKTLKSTHRSHKTKTAAKKKAVAVKTKKAANKAVSAKKIVAKEGAVKLYDLKGHVQEQVTLDPILLDGAVNTDVVYQAILMYQAGEREGTAATKTRGEVRGGGKKPWKQKGTGQARHGSRRSPIWRGGGVTFGPHPRDYSYSIPSQTRRKAVVEAMKDKISNGKMMLVSQLELDSPKTKTVAHWMDALKLVKPLLLVEKRNENLLLASRNIREMSVKTADEVNALDVALHKEFVLTKGAYLGLIKRLKS